MIDELRHEKRGCGNVGFKNCVVVKIVYFDQDKLGSAPVYMRAQVDVSRRTECIVFAKAMSSQKMVYCIL